MFKRMLGLWLENLRQTHSIPQHAESTVSEASELERKYHKLVHENKQPDSQKERSLTRSNNI